MLQRSVFAALMVTLLIGFLAACSPGGEPGLDTLETTTETRGDDTGGDDTGGDDTGGDDTGGDDTGGDDTGGDDTGGAY